MGTVPFLPLTPESSLPTLEIALAVAVRQGRALVARRSPDAHLGGLWEFPGGKIESGEEPAEAARRELREEAGLEGGSLEPLTLFVHSYPDRTVRLHAFLIREPAGEVRVDGDREWAWLAREELLAVPMPEANAAILRALGWRL